MSRKDDLEQVFYVLVEMTIGALPWRELDGDQKAVGGRDQTSHR